MSATPSHVPKAIDLAARSIDLLAVLIKASQGTVLSEVGSLVMKELGKWLGKEGLDENELQFFLDTTKGIVAPNGQDQVTKFFLSVTSREPRASVLPLWAQQSGALSRYVSRDFHQRWLTSTICCLFRYHDERFIKWVLCGLIMQSLRKDKAPLSEYQLAQHPDTLRLNEVVNKVVHSTWSSIANAGLIGSESECPHLPDELKWACKKGHNIESYKLSLIMSRLLDPPSETIIQSEHLLTNLVLWLLWHFNGRLRIVVSGHIEYDKVLGPETHIIEFRVSKYCSKDVECASKGVPVFEMLNSVSGSLKTIFRGKYDSQQTLMSMPRVRQKLYDSPFQYPKGSHNSIKIQTQRTAQEILRWFVERPVSGRAFTSKFDFNIKLTSNSNESTSPKLRIGDLLGRTPGLLNMQCGDLGRAFVVFSVPHHAPSPTVENFMDMNSEDMKSSGDINDTFEERPEFVLRYFPILQDLVDAVRTSCRCFHCNRPNSDSGFLFDMNCLQYKAFMEVMFYFAHGIADAFGAPDVSSCSEIRAGDSGATAVLLEAVHGVRMGLEYFEGLISWHTLLSMTTQVFLGCPPLDKLTDATENDGSVDTSPHVMQHLSSNVIAVQYGDLAVVAPWLDITQHLSCHRSFRFEVVRGRFCLPIPETSSKVFFQEVARDTAVIETQHTEDVSDYATRHKVQPYLSGSAVQISADMSESFCEYVLVSVDQTRYKLLMRVSSTSHSRMVDPSTAMLKTAAQVFPVRCKHGNTMEGIVPEQYSAELYDFEELLGRWGDTTKRETISTDNSPTPSEPDIDNEDISGIDPKKREEPSTPSKESKSSQAKNRNILRVSQSLKTSFKYNIALALTNDDPVFVNRGDACLQCCLHLATSFNNTDLRPSYAKWVINYARNPERYVPKSPFRVDARKVYGTIEKRAKRRLESGPASRDDDVMELNT